MGKTRKVRSVQIAEPQERRMRTSQHGHVPGRQAHEVVFILRRMVEQASEWRIPIFVMDCDVAAAFDHVSHHVIIDAMEALQVPPVFVAAWIREYRRSETFVKLDDIMTPGFVAYDRCHKVTRAPCLGAALDILKTASCARCQTEKWELPPERGIHGARTFRGQLLAHRDVASRTQMHGNEPLGKCWIAHRVGRGLDGVHRHRTVWRRPPRCPTQ